MRGWWQDLSDLVLPAQCAGCGESRTSLCTRCTAALRGAAPSRVRPCPEPPGLPVVHAAAPYRDAVRAVLLAHKERGALGLAGPLGTALAGAVREGLPARQPGQGPGPGLTRGGAAVLALVPVPSAPGAVRARGHDPMRRIACAAAAGLRRAGMPARVLPVLRQRRAVADQAGLDAAQRLANVTGALEAAGGSAGLLAEVGRIVLVDDVMTTGASLAEAARVLRALRRSVSGSGEGGEGGAGREGAGMDREMRSGLNMIEAAVVAASPDSFEINRN